ncbi:MAG: serine O-acetyltransferase, partial [Lachnospiraceae bacterium]|nr:serine O-acetyltransferase [Lachnospiraceae bacterium]
GAKVLGSFKIGDNCKIGAGSVVLEEVPPNSTVVGVPGRVVKRFDATLPQDKLDQIHLPDPVMEDIANLQRANSELINRVLELEARIKNIDREAKIENQSE